MLRRRLAPEPGQKIAHLLREVFGRAAAGSGQGARGELIAAGRAPEAEIDAPRKERLEYAKRLGHLEGTVVLQHHAARADTDGGRSEERRVGKECAQIGGRSRCKREW